MSAAAGPQNATKRAPKLLELSGPESLPPRQCDRMFSVNCGNTSLSWSFHDVSNEYIPLSCWVTGIPKANHKLPNYLPVAIHDWLFGESNPANHVASAIKFASGKRVGTIYLYLVSSNANHRAALLQLFAGLPVQVYTVKAQDFQKALPAGTDIYSTVGVDRVAGLAAAQYLCPSAPSCMVLDGGTAFTYTTIKNQRICGGIGLGIAAKVDCLLDISGIEALPPQTLMDMIDQVDERTAWMSEKPDSQEEVVKTVLRETALTMCGALRSFLDQSATAASLDLAALPVVIVCGGDGDTIFKLLQSNVLNSLASSGTAIPNMDLYAAHTIKEPKRYVVVRERSLIRFGLQSLLVSQTPKTPLESERLRSDLIGTRVLLRRPPEGRQVYGFIASVVRSGDRESLKKDKFKVFTDEGNEEALDGIFAVYDALLLYSTHGEEARKPSDHKIALLNKHKDAQEMVDALKGRSAEIKARIRAEAEAKARAELAKKARAEKERLENIKAREEVSRREKETQNSKRQAEDDASSSKKIRTELATVSGEAFVGRRVAKYFNDDLYYGVVKAFYPKDRVEERIDLWHIVYDDEDSEDVDLENLEECLLLHSQNKAGDPKGGS